MRFIAHFLSHPLTRGLSVDDPAVTQLRRDIIQGKPFLRKIYAEWYRKLLLEVGDRQPILELGSGGGFIREFSNNIITSEVMPVPGVAIIANGCQLPFANGVLGAIILTNVFHHIPKVSQFLSEATRCIAEGGRIVMIEPWVSPWANLIYRHLHTEPFDVDGSWELGGGGPLSTANGALPWIVFERDRHLFARKFPEWHILTIKPMMPFTYLLSGGVSLRNLMPGWSYIICRKFEKFFNNKNWAMFSLIVLEKRSIEKVQE